MDLLGRFPSIRCFILIITNRLSAEEVGHQDQSLTQELSFFPWVTLYALILLRCIPLEELLQNKISHHLCGLQRYLSHHQDLNEVVQLLRNETSPFDLSPRVLYPYTTKLVNITPPFQISWSIISSWQ